MKKGVHPTWHHDCVVTCACGDSFKTGSIQKAITIDICSNCHPFFTGEMKFVDRQGRVDKFMQQMKAAQEKQSSGKAKKAKKPSESKEDHRSYRQILQSKKKQIKQTAKAA